VLLDCRERANADVGHGFDEALQKLSAAGADLIEVRLPAPFDLIAAIHWTISTSEGAPFTRSSLRIIIKTTCQPSESGSKYRN
jgi:hypothetical protein